MQSKFKRILFGGDYNPNQWPKEVWEQDMAYFKDAHINSATINVFHGLKYSLLRMSIISQSLTR